MENFDYLFKEKEITDQAYSAPIAVVGAMELERREGAKALVLPMALGKLYTVRAARPVILRTALCSDLGTLACEESEQIPFDEAKDFICTPLKAGLSLVIDAEDASPLGIFETPILLGHDTEDAWFYPEVGIHLEKGKAGCYGDRDWTTEELLQNVYEPLRAKHPECIRREVIGYDESGKYKMYAYTFAPKGYEKTLFITAAIHGDEFIGALALSRLISLVWGEECTHEGLAYLREKTRLIVIPVVNVWSRAEARGRKNAKDVDLNRDFGDFSQAESRAVAALMHEYKEEIDCVMDLHCANGRWPGMWYQFNVQASNAAAAFKCINHTFERNKARGYETEPDLSKIPGKYIKSNAFLQGYAYNELGLANIVIEHNLSKWYEPYSAEAFANAVECYANFIIQTALAKYR